MRGRFTTNYNASMLLGRRKIRLLRRVVFPTDVSAFVITLAHLCMCVCRVCTCVYVFVIMIMTMMGTTAAIERCLGEEQRVWRTIRHCG